VTSTVTYIIAVTSKKRLDGHRIVVELPAGARNSFLPKICTSFLQQVTLKSQMPQCALCM